MSALSFATAQVLRLLPRASIGRAFGHLADVSWPQPVGQWVVDTYSRLYRVDFDDCVESGGFKSFDHFFTRRLREGARPIDTSADVIVSPSDGHLGSMGRIEPGSRYHVKGHDYSVADLVGGADEAKRYDGGGGCVIYLSPRDYHRVHSPVAGTLGRIASLPGDYFPVNDIGLKHVPGLFAVNRRVAIGVDTPPETGLGRVAVVMVSAMIVGRITLSAMAGRDVPMGEHAFEPAPAVERGGELGIFHLGSTVVMFMEPQACASWTASEGPIRLGQPLCRVASTVQPGKPSSGDPGPSRGSGSGRKRNGSRAGRGAG